MSAPNRSFFSGLHLLITGLAALVTASVALFGVAVNQGWLNGNASRPAAVPGASTGSTGSTGSAGGASGTTDATVPQYSVDPASVVFQSFGPTTAPVKVTNTGVVSLTVEPPTFSQGPDASHFSAGAGTCGAGPVDPGRSCQIDVTFKHASGTFNATLVVQVDGAARATEVPIQASAIL